MGSQPGRRGRITNRDGKEGSVASSYHAVTWRMSSIPASVFLSAMWAYISIQDKRDKEDYIKKLVLIQYIAH